MAEPNRKHTSRTPITPIRRRKKPAREVQPQADVHSLKATTEAAAVDLEQKETSKPLVIQAQNAMGIVGPDVATILAAQAAAMAPCAGTADNPDKKRNLIETAVQLLGEIKPEGALQSMLAVQMIGVHNTAVNFVIKAAGAGTVEVEESYLHRATRLMRLFTEQLEALASLRGKTSEQKVTVEHVHVHEGGQAFVGNLTRNGEVPPRGQGEGNAN